VSDADVVLDTGALIAVERGSDHLNSLTSRLESAGLRLVIPAPALAQVWRGGSRQALLSRFLKLQFVEVDVLSRALWQATGELCGISGTSDVVDASVIMCAHTRHARVVLTSDPGDLRRLDPGLTYIVP
jgi:hypothetical protein